MEANTGRISGTWEVNVASHAVSDARKPSIEIVTFSEEASRAYILTKSSVLESDSSLVPLMGKISPYQPRNTRAVRGSEYDFVDFRVRVGLIFGRHESTTGVVVEIEYRPCPFTSECESLISELMEGIAAPLVPAPQNSHDPNTSEAAHTAATTAFNYQLVQADNDSNPKDLVPFSNRTSALLYAKLLRS